jgi:hypothetical protein
MKYIYKHPETGELAELNDGSDSKDFRELYEKGYKILKSVPETIEDESMSWGEEPSTHMKINDL